MLSRRHVLAGAIAAPALLNASRGQAAQTLKISHQFPGGTIDQGDFRDRLCRKFAQEISKRTNGALVAEVYPNSSLMKTNAQFSAMRKGALDMSLYPMPYAGGELPEMNIGLMPCLVSSYEQGAAWKNAEIGREMTKFLADKGIVMVSWIWQAGGCAHPWPEACRAGGRQGPKGPRRLARNGHDVQTSRRRCRLDAVE